MSEWHEGPFCGVDFETTSADPETARIVTAAVIVRGSTADVTAAWLSDCGGEEIPAEATAVHGITTETARDLGLDGARVTAEICDQLTRHMCGWIPLVIYNAPYDLTVLDRETRRYGMEPFADILARHEGLVVDPLVLDKHADRYRRGRRTLTAACEHYKVALDGAHDATADALAAMRVAWRIGCAYPALAALTPRDLHELQVDARAEQAAGFQEYLTRKGTPEVIDGSWPIRELAEVIAP